MQMLNETQVVAAATVIAANVAQSDNKQGSIAELSAVQLAMVGGGTCIVCF